MCVLGPEFNLCMVHFFSSTNNIIKSLQLLFCTIISIILILVIEDSMWKFHVEWWNPQGIHMESTRNPHGIHVEYRWKEITKMGEISAKTYSMWNGQNPHGTTWIPHRFHMDSMWNKGAW